jgi:hypothetical protein
LYLPPGFANITWKLFIVHGVLCIGAAAQFFLTYASYFILSTFFLLMSICNSYPETCGKTLEEIEEMFSPGGPRPWKTKKGNSKLDALIEEAREKHLQVKDVGVSGAFHHEENVTTLTEAGGQGEKTETA